MTDIKYIIILRCLFGYLIFSLEILYNAGDYVLPDYSQEYCELSEELCGPGELHVSCGGKSWSYGEHCKKREGDKIEVLNIQIFKYDIRDILQRMNTIRNTVAAGLEPNYKPAVRMGKMAWDVGLAQMAILGVLRCGGKPDICHNTPEYRCSGQTVFIWEDWDNAIHWRKAIKVALTGIGVWAEERINGQAKYTDKFEHNPGGKPFDNYATLILESNNRVGCGLLKIWDTSTNYTKVFFTCNYASDVVEGRRVYKSGRATSECETGTTSTHRFTELCTIYEKYGNNYPELPTTEVGHLFRPMTITTVLVLLAVFIIGVLTIIRLVPKKLRRVN